MRVKNSFGLDGKVKSLLRGLAAAMAASLVTSADFGHNKDNPNSNGANRGRRAKHVISIPYSDDKVSIADALAKDKDHLTHELEL